MSQERKLMKMALKEVFIPELRKRSFKGSFPHFRRMKESRIDFLTIQFNNAGGSFVVEIAKSGPNGIEKGYGSQHPVKKLNVGLTHLVVFKIFMRLAPDFFDKFYKKV